MGIHLRISHIWPLPGRKKNCSLRHIFIKIVVKLLFQLISYSIVAGGVIPAMLKKTYFTGGLKTNIEASK